MRDKVDLISGFGQDGPYDLVQIRIRLPVGKFLQQARLEGKHPIEWMRHMIALTFDQELVPMLEDVILEETTQGPVED